MARFGRSLTLAWVVAGMLGALAAPAGADTNLGTVSGLTYIQGNPTGPAPPPAVLSSTATCPPGTHVVGGGATPASSAPSTARQFWLNGSRPFDGPDSDPKPDDGWIGRGYNRWGSDKSFWVYAICFQGSVGYVTADGSAVAGRGMNALAPCPSGTHVASGGGAVQGGATASYLNGSHPIDSGDPDTRPDDGWKARGFNLSGVAKHLVVYATCVSLDPRYEQRRVIGSDPVLFNACPDGTHAMGGGAIAGAVPRQAFLNALYPFPGTTDPPDAGFVASIHNAGRSTELRNFVACKT